MAAVSRSKISAVNGVVRPFRFLFLPNVPHHLAGQSLPGYGAEIPAVRAVDLRAAHFNSAAPIQHPMDALNQRAITGLAKDNHIASPDFTRREGNARGQDKITLPDIREETVPANLQQTKHQKELNLEDGDDHFIADRIGRIDPLGLFALDLPEDLGEFIDGLKQRHS